MVPHCSLVGSVEETWEIYKWEMASLSWNAVPGCLSCSLFPHCAFPKWSLPHMHCVACAGQCINSNLYLECYGLRIWNSCQPVDAAAICPLGTFWRARLLLCKMLNHKNETPILCINQQLVAVVTTAVCLIAGSYTFVCQKETQCLRHSTSSRIYPTCFLSPSRHHADPALPYLLCLWEVSLVSYQPKSKTGQTHMSQTWLAGSHYPGITIG